MFEKQDFLEDFFLFFFSVFVFLGLLKFIIGTF